MDSVMGVRREILATFLAALVLAMGIFAASANAKHGADDGRHHHHHGGVDGPRHG